MNVRGDVLDHSQTNHSHTLAVETRSCRHSIFFIASKVVVTKQLPYGFSYDF
jgi:hypothetical protein